MLRVLLAVALITISREAIAEEVLTFTEKLETKSGTVSVPVELYLDDPTDTELAIKVAGNLRGIQKILPATLSGVVVNDCEQRVGLEMQEAVAEGDAIRVRGRVQIILYSCNETGEFDSRVLIISNITSVDALLQARISDNCLVAELNELILDPSGIVGGIMNLTGITQSLSDTVRQEVNASLSGPDNCIDLPEPLQVLETRIKEAGFRDFGGGTLGFVIKSSIKSKSGNLIKLFLWLDKEGLLDGGCDCEQGG